MRIVKFIFLMLIFCSLNACRKDLVLREDSLGPLKLSIETLVSTKTLRQLFSYFTITHDIHSGDSPDFHYFEVID